jgi:seryl-tRNA synthetase
MERPIMNADKSVGRLEERLRHWGAKLDQLVTRADEVDAEARADYQKRLEEFREKHHAAKLKLAEVKAAGSEKWSQFKADVESSTTELEHAFRQLMRPSQR